MLRKNIRIIDKIYRHPIKSIGCELLDGISLYSGKTMPGDRVWALAHNKTRMPSTKKEWMPCSSFLRGTIAPSFMAITSLYNEDNGTITLMHPNQDQITFNPDKKAELNLFLKWIQPLCPSNGPSPYDLYKIGDRGLTDTEYPSISLLSIESLNELSTKIGSELDPRRFRGNLWLSGGKPFEEFDWLGQEIILGSSKLKVIERIERCNATKVNPLSGERDINTLNGLNIYYGHQDFGVYCEILTDGKIEKGNQLIFC
ncbi:MAG: MOSC domain-containing protein [Paracoccaceae bacterium]